jgi:aminopeptidase N
MTKTVKRLYETFQPEHYMLSITPSSETMHFSGTVEITGKKTGRPSQRLTFHQVGLKITSARVIKHDKKGDAEIAITRINNQDTLHEVRLHSDSMLYPGNYTVTMEFEAPITKNMEGLYPCFFNHEGADKTLLMTQLESHHAREVFPCIDEPEAKATFDLSLATPKGLVTLSNMPIKTQATSKVSPDLMETTFETTPKMSSYLLAFVIGELHNKSGKTKRGTEVSIWGTVAQPQDHFDFALDTAIACVEYFEAYFDTPYPLPKYDQVAVPDFASGAMENWGLVTYREVALLLDPTAVSQSAKEMIAEVVAHETTHQWFGNLVTMKWWDDLWLNESFANMMEYDAVDHLFPKWKSWNNFVAGEGISAFRRDAVPGVQAVKVAVNHPDDIHTIFDPSIVYAKGGRLLYMLKNYIGEEDFKKGLQSYFKKYAYSNTTGADLWQSLSDASSKDIGVFMNPWLERSGFPVVSISQKGNTLKLTQTHFSENPEKADNTRVWPIPLFAERDDVPTIFDTPTLEITLDSDEFVMLNQGGKGHYIVQYGDTEHRNSLNERIASQDISEIDRLTLLTSSSMLAKSGYQSIAETLDLLQAYKNESSDIAWDAMAITIGDTRRFIEVDENLEQPIKELIRTLVTNEYQRLGWIEREDDSVADLKLRATILGLGAYAEQTDIVQHALQLFDECKSDPGVVSAELRSIVFSVAVKENVDGAVDFLLDLHAKTNSSDLQRDIAGAITATKSIDVADRILKLVPNSSVLRTQDSYRWVFYLLRNRYVRENAWQWMEENWTWIKDTYGNGNYYDSWPRFAASICATKEWQRRYTEFFTPKLDELMLKPNITIGLEEIQNRVDWLNRDIASVQEYFAK